MRTSIAIALACLVALPTAADAAGLAVADAAATTAGIEPAEVARVRALFEQALRETGVELIPSGKNAIGAEFVASLSLARSGEDLLLVGQVSRVRLDQWSARAEVRVPGGAPEALGAAVQDLAGKLTLAMQTAPARTESEPAARPAPRKVRAAAATVAE